MFYRRNEKYDTFFVNLTGVYKTWNECHFFFQIKWSILRISLAYCFSQVSQVIALFHSLLQSSFSSYCFISFITKKSKREISRVFSAFRRFSSKQKYVDFFPLFLFGLFDWQLSKHGAKLRLKSSHLAVLVFCSCEGELRWDLIRWMKKWWGLGLRLKRWET